MVIFWAKQTKTKKHQVSTPSLPSQRRTTPLAPIFHIPPSETLRCGSTHTVIVDVQHDFYLFVRQEATPGVDLVIAEEGFTVRIEASSSISRRVECKETCNQGNFLESATGTQKTAYFSLVKLDLSNFQRRLPKKELKNIWRQIWNLDKKQRAAASSRRGHRGPTPSAHNPRSLPVCILAGQV